MLSRIEFGSGGIWCGPRVLPVLWEGKRKIPKNTTGPLESQARPRPYPYAHVEEESDALVFFPQNGRPP